MSIRAPRIAKYFGAVLAAISLSSLASAQQPNIDVNTIVSRLTQAQLANRERLKAYMLTRTYQVYNGDEQKPKSVITAEVSYVPPQQKDFKVQQSTGGMAERVVRKALEHEVKMTKDPKATQIDADNYDFEYQGTQKIWGHDCYVLKLNPKRETKDLLKGTIWVDAQKFLIRRVEGQPAKDPSWWVNDVKIALTFDEVEGMWLQTSTDAHAHVRFAGAYRMVSKDNEVRTAESLASNRGESIRKVRRAIVPAVAIAR